MLGGLTILTSYALEPAIACLWRRRHHYSQMEWCVNETLQLQRLAHETSGRGGAWRRTTEFIPVTAPGEELAPLDLSDPAHPVLVVVDEKKVAVRERTETFGSEWSGSPPSSSADDDGEKKEKM